jgi:hypothetical protein
MAQLPGWQSLDAGIPVPSGANAGRIVAVVASEGAVEAGWAGNATLDLARAWSAAGEKVIVADGALHYPTLHDCAATENFEGLSDAALFGLSVGRVAKPVEGGFFLITAGTAVANANAVAGSPRWAALLSGFVEAGVKLLLFVRDGDSGCAAFLGSASDIIVLARPDERAPAAVRDLEGMVRAVTGPGGPGGNAAVADAASGLRPPEEWTSSGPGGQRRIMMMAGAAVLIVLVLVVLLVVLGFVPAADPSPQSLDSVSLFTAGAVATTP